MQEVIQRNVDQEVPDVPLTYLVKSNHQEASSFVVNSPTTSDLSSTDFKQYPDLSPSNSISSISDSSSVYEREEAQFIRVAMDENAIQDAAQVMFDIYLLAKQHYSEIKHNYRFSHYQVEFLVAGLSQSLAHSGLNQELVLRILNDMMNLSTDISINEIQACVKYAFRSQAQRALDRILRAQEQLTDQIQVLKLQRASDGIRNIEVCETIVATQELIMKKMEQMGHIDAPINSSKDSILFVVVYYGRLKLVKWLISMGANITLINAHGQSALDYAIMRHYTDISITLMGHGAVVTDPELLKLLYSDLLQIYGNKSLRSKQKAYSKSLRTCFQAGGNLSKRQLRRQDGFGLTPLHWATLLQMPHIVKIFVQHPLVKPNAADHIGRIPLHIAFRTGNKEIISTLVQQQGVNRYMKDMNGDTPLHSYVRYLYSQTRLRSTLLTNPFHDILDDRMLAKWFNFTPSDPLVVMYNAGRLDLVHHYKHTLVCNLNLFVMNSSLNIPTDFFNIEEQLVETRYVSVDSVKQCLLGFIRQKLETGQIKFDLGTVFSVSRAHRILPNKERHYYLRVVDYGVPNKNEAALKAIQMAGNKIYFINSRSVGSIFKMHNENLMIKYNNCKARAKKDPTWNKGPLVAIKDFSGDKVTILYGKKLRNNRDIGNLNQGVLFRQFRGDTMLQTYMFSVEKDIESVCDENVSAIWAKNKQGWTPLQLAFHLIDQHSR